MKTSEILIYILLLISTVAAFYFYIKFYLQLKISNSIYQKKELWGEIEESTNVGSLIYNMSTKELELFKGLLNLLKLAPSKKINFIGLLYFVCKEDRKRVLQKVKSLIENKRPFELEIQYKSGQEYRFARINAKFIENNNASSFIIGNMIDTNRETLDSIKLTEQYNELLTTKEQLGDLNKILKENKTILQKVNRELLMQKWALDEAAIVVVTDREGYITYINEKFIQISGYSKEELIGKTHQTVNSNFHDDEFFVNLWKTIITGKKWSGEICNITKDRKLYWVNTTIIPFVDYNENPYQYLAIQFDITSQKRNEEELRITIDQYHLLLEHQHKQSIELKLAKENAEKANQIKSEFLANMSHEIRTPMNAILGFSEILEKRIQDKENKEYLNHISSSSKVLLRLINDILDLSKIEAGKLQLEYMPVNPSNVIKEIGDIFLQKITDKGLEIKFDLHNSMNSFFLMDEIRLRQIILNLIGNAVKFTDKGYIKISGKSVEDLNNLNKSTIKISIEDTGIGIPEEQKNSIFEAFNQRLGQSHAKYGGTGLGLAICSKLTKIMKGELFLESEVNKGSIFTLIIPEVQNVERTIHSIEDSFLIDEVEFQPSTILIAEDTLNNRELFRKYLVTQKFTILEVENGLEAIQILKKQKVDLIIMDINMPVLDGLKASKIIKEELRLFQIPIIAVTASAMKEEVENIQKNFDSLMIKPINQKNLFYELMKYLDYKIQKIEPLFENNLKNIIQEEQKNLLSKEILLILINRLKYDGWSYWENAIRVKGVDEIETFCSFLNELSDKYNCSDIQNYSNSILEQLNVFNIPKVTDLMNQFPRLIQEIEVLYN